MKSFLNPKPLLKFFYFSQFKTHFNNFYIFLYSIISFLTSLFFLSQKSKPSLETLTMRNWSEMNKDTLSLIIKKIKNPSDHIKISAICSSWRTIAKQYRFELSSSIPGLIISLRNRNALTFFNFQDENSPGFESHYTYKNLGIIFTSLKLYGSHRGWVVLTLEDQIQCSVTLLHNPFANLCRLLPDMPKNVVKAVLSCSPSFDDRKCIVLIIFREGNAAFCRVGDVCWQNLRSFDNDEVCFCDALFFKERFYGVDDHGRIYTVNLDQGLIIEASSQPSDITKLPRKYYLVELKGELCRVRRKFVYTLESIYYDEYEEEDEDDDIIPSYSDLTRSFRVWRMDSGQGKWVEQKSLGECALFLGKNVAICISQSELKGIRGNKIYFTDDRNRFKDYYVRPGEDMGIYDMKNSKIDPICSLKCEWWIDPPAIWVEPLPW